jgi:hypothetical protein
MTSITFGVANATGPMRAYGNIFFWNRGMERTKSGLIRTTDAAAGRIGPCPIP